MLFLVIFLIALVLIGAKHLGFISVDTPQPKEEPKEDPNKEGEPSPPLQTRQSCPPDIDISKVPIKPITGSDNDQQQTTEETRIHPSVVPSEDTATAPTPTDAATPMIIDRQSDQLQTKPNDVPKSVPVDAKPPLPALATPKSVPVNGKPAVPAPVTPAKEDKNTKKKTEKKKKGDNPKTKPKSLKETKDIKAPSKTTTKPKDTKKSKKKTKGK